MNNNQGLEYGYFTNSLIIAQDLTNPPHETESLLMEQIDKVSFRSTELNNSFMQLPGAYYTWPDYS